MKVNHLINLGLLAVTLSVATPATAAVTTYDNSEKNAFFDDLASGAYFESFSSYKGDVVATNPIPQTFSFGGDTFTLTDNDTIFYSTGAPGQGSIYPSVNAPFESFTLDFTSQNITAIGGTFFLTDLSFVPSAGGNVTATLATGESVTQASTGSYNTEPFTGFTSSTPFTSLTITAPSENELFLTLDSLYLGQSFDVPEPKTWALLLGGFALLLGFRRHLRA